MDDELEERLRRYRPVGPPPGLRARVVALARTPPRRQWGWLPSVAAAAAAITFYVMASSVRREQSDEFRTLNPRPEAIARTLAAELGGDDVARAVAARLIELNGVTAGSAEADTGLFLNVESDRHD